jgi:hypothetical protein
MITAEWTAILATLGEKASVVLGIYLGFRLLLIGLVAGVATFHHDEERRADARKVLKRLLPYGRRHRSVSRAAKTLPPPDGGAQPPEQVASARQIAQVHPKRLG